MPLDPYASCPCGSGKKFKWCCAPFFPQIERAIELDGTGQHETAHQVMQQVCREHGDKAAVWGYYAQFLYNNGQAEKADEALTTALKLNPNFGMALYLRGMFRLNEGEYLGALLLFRKAAEAYDPEAAASLAQVYIEIFQIEFTLNRPIAARAALERAAHFQPADPELRGDLERIFGKDSRLPACIRKPYSFRPTARPASVEAATGKFSDARRTFEALTQQTPGDPAAWFNLGLVLAWMGEQPRAAEALGKSIELETDDHRAEEAAALREVLHCSQGMENDSDYLEHGYVMTIRDPAPVMKALQDLERARRLVGVKMNEETGVITATIVEELPSLLAVGATNLSRVVAKMLIGNGIVRLWHPSREALDKVLGEFRDRVQLAVEPPVEVNTPIQLGDVALEAIVFPTQMHDLEQAEEKLREYARHFFEDVWVHRARKSLGGSNLLDAVGSKLLRKRVFGIIKFVEDCYQAVIPVKQVGEELIRIEGYNFDSLRHKLGLEYVSAPPPTIEVGEVVSPDAAKSQAEASPSPIPQPQAPAKREIGAMSTAELAGLDVSALSLDELEQAVRAALKLDAKDLAVAFAQAGAMKPFDAAKPDRYLLYACLITGAIAEGEPAKALKFAEEGAAYDAQHNESKRANDYGMRKAQLYVKLKETDRAASEFEGLIGRNPGEGRFYTAAAEAMLRPRNGPKAQEFAEKGVAKAREIHNRDLEGHCLELLEAAKRLK